MKATFDAVGEVLIVTGGASGIGAAIAESFASAGGQVVTLDITEPSTTSAGVHHITCDVANRDQVFAAVADVLDRHGRIDGLVTAAAVEPRMPVVDTDPDMWRHVIDVNLNGV
ncbi:MAG: SDR family NAD(P)-dependent oxidoreductase, partial [Actinomycetes bacterium]